MARPRADTGNFAREPHSVSLKVLRLSRPSLIQQHPLPRENDSNIARAASLAYPSQNSDYDLNISSNLGLPPAFGSAHVGETFSCSLCANNELPESSLSRSVTGIKIIAEMQTPSHTVSLQPMLSITEDDDSSSKPGSSLQRIVQFDLKEEGNHVLSVNVNYTENSTSDEGQITGGRVRSFRKLYQFLAQPCLSVRTKASELSPIAVAIGDRHSYDRTTLLRYALEAQLENVSEGSIVLEQTKLQAHPPFKVTSLNWDVEDEENRSNSQPILNPRDVLQIAFLIEQESGVSIGLDDLKDSLKRNGRASLGQLAISWRSGMGESGSLSTGNLLTRKRIL